MLPPSILVILLSFYFGLLYYGARIGETDLPIFLLFSTVASCLFIALYVLLKRFLGNRHKAALCTLVFLFIFCSYGHLYAYASKLFVYRLNSTLMGLTAVLLIATFVLVRRAKDIKPLYDLAGKGIIILFLLNAGHIAYTLASRSADMETTSSEVSLLANQSIVEKPNIIFLIPDAYARRDVLSQEHEYDNTPFISRLEELGFHVVANSTSNYSSTRMSIPSSLGMQYWPEGKLLPLKSRPPLAVQFLMDQGYEIYNISSNMALTGRFDYAQNVNIYVASEAMEYICKSTLLYPLFVHFGQELFMDMRREITVNALKTLGPLAKQDGPPKFIFVHLLSPHGPYVFGPNGEHIYSNPSAATNKAADISGFKGQLHHLNKLLLEQIEDILANAKRKNIFIIQSDHGAEFFSMTTLDEVREHSTNHKAKNFIAIYYPDQQLYSHLPASLSNVNILRATLNAYFQQHFEMLPNRYYYNWEVGKFGALEVPWVYW